MSFLQTELVLERMKNALNLRTNKDLAEKLDVSTQTLSGWKVRNALPLEEILKFSSTHQISLDWLLWGEEKLMKILDTYSILERMKSYLNIKNDEDLGIELGKEQDKAATAVRNWRSRNNLPFEVILEFAKSHNLSLDWLIFDQVQNQLDTAQQMALTAFNALDDQKKIQAISFMSGLQKEASTGGMNIRTGDNSTN
ncbi:helix-turn-helix domain-containing protein, partial [Muribacter muris]|uniref:helix-turn-helix domain-containing protein n=1 Tax=Muribacter muris TaxID=67855 RepID=UPI00069E5789